MRSDSATAAQASDRDATPVLRLDGLRTGYGDAEAVSEISLEVAAGEVVTLIGHNGAGKTTTLRAVMGLQRVWSGRILLAGEDITGLRASDGIRRGIGMVPEQGFVFGELSIEDNLRLAGAPVPPAELATRRDAVYERFPVLRERRTQRAESLSGGEQRMLSLGMTLLGAPRLLLLDEPSLGLAPFLVERIMEEIRQIAAEHRTAVLLVEQNVGQALRVADRAYVMRSGTIVADERADELAKRERLWELF